MSITLLLYQHFFKEIQYLPSLFNRDAVENHFRTFCAIVVAVGRSTTLASNVEQTTPSVARLIMVETLIGSHAKYEIKLK